MPSSIIIIKITLNHQNSLPKNNFESSFMSKFRYKPMKSSDAEEADIDASNKCNRIPYHNKTSCIKTKTRIFHPYCQKNLIAFYKFKIDIKK